MTVEKEDHVISEFLKSIGKWKNYIVIGGGYALIIYKLFLTDQNLKNTPVGTSDIDSLIPRKVPKISQKNIAKHLCESGFTPVFKDLDSPATESYLKEINGVEVEVEFLTDSSVRFEKHKNVVIAGVVAQPLNYIELSLKETLEFHTSSGETGWVVAPEAWLFHKGLTFTKRKSASKILKDLYGIWYVGTQLGNFSEDAIISFHLLGERYPKWFKSFQKNVFNWLSQASPLEFSKLESQDPSGHLKKLHFVQTMKMLIQKS